MPSGHCKATRRGIGVALHKRAAQEKAAAGTRSPRRRGAIVQAPAAGSVRHVLAFQLPVARRRRDAKDQVPDEGMPATHLDKPRERPRHHIEVEDIDQHAEHRARQHGQAQARIQRERRQDRRQDHAQHGAQHEVDHQCRGHGADAEQRGLQHVRPHHDRRDHARGHPGVHARHHRRPEQFQHQQQRARRQPRHRCRGPVRQSPHVVVRLHVKFHSHLRLSSAGHRTKGETRPASLLSIGHRFRGSGRHAEKRLAMRTWHNARARASACFDTCPCERKRRIRDNPDAHTVHPAHTAYTGITKERDRRPPCTSPRMILYS
ncbi:hypothetical protein CBM2587_B90207 [Cupriavidus taiwanensis]|uniref:Uncharacterized protein n=1 Tax=Cupriavidus taiwanensis TaxID=164546 RepID=A0A976A837_9BURK|nr:hypothetical protein CBM2587_B90207 [Cupriavidus taiwanensis]